MKHIGTKTIETERLILRKFRLSDVKNMFDNYCNSDKVTEYVLWHTHKTLQDTKNLLNNMILPAYKEKSTYRWAIVLKEINQVIGYINVVESNDKLFRAELAWAIGDKFWGQGIVPEAAKAVLNFLFDLGYIRIQAGHDISNPKSGRVMEKIGMKFEGTRRKYTTNKYGVLVDSNLWAILNTDKR